MGRPAGWMTALTGRSPMKSPGAPLLRREVEREFWREIAKGLFPEEAANRAGVSQAAGSRWFRHGGGMPSVDLAPLSGRYLSFREREEIAILRAQEAGVREIARRLGRAPSTVSRELRRNAATRGGKLEYRASVARWKSDLVRAVRELECQETMVNADEPLRWPLVDVAEAQRRVLKIQTKL
jgi:Helix-turn-helix domain